jgi:hypothetical protein
MGFSFTDANVDVPVLQSELYTLLRRISTEERLLARTGVSTSLRRLFAYAQQPITFEHPEANPQRCHHTVESHIFTLKTCNSALAQSVDDNDKVSCRMLHRFPGIRALAFCRKILCAR